MAQDWWIGDQSVRNVDPARLNIQPPIPVPPSDQIPLKISIGCTSRVRLSEVFQPTITYTAPFLYTTDLLNYATLVPIIATTVWDYVNSEKAQNAIVETHCGLWIDNVTHAPTGAGVVRLPKANRDTQLSNEEFTSAQVLQDHLNGNISDLRNTVKY